MTTDDPIRFRNFADDDRPTWTAKARPSGADAEPRPHRFEGEGLTGSELPSAHARPKGPGRLLAWGAGFALVGGVAIAVALLPRHSALADDGGGPGATLQIHRYVARPNRLTPGALLPCYVAGVPIGSLSVPDCGQRNGVASGQLDVGLSPRVAAADETYRGSESGSPQSPPVARFADAAPPGREVFARAEPPPPAVSPRALEPSRRDAYLQPRVSDDRGESAAGRVDPADSIRAAQTFYESLADGDGARAASVVVPEKRRQGPLSAGALDRFYSDLDEPLRLTRLYPLDDHTVVARYAFVTRDGNECQGTARVTTTERDGETLIQGVRALNGC
jgi:hypothetical protein